MAFIFQRTHFAACRTLRAVHRKRLAERADCTLRRSLMPQARCSCYVKKVIGWALLQDRLPLNDCALMVSGRGGFEIIQKAIVTGIPVVASVSAPSSLAVQLARRMNLTLVGFLRGRRFVIYSGEERLIPSEKPK
jgi:hypothetical protein